MSKAKVDVAILTRGQVQGIKTNIVIDHFTWITCSQVLAYFLFLDLVNIVSVYALAVILIRIEGRILF